MPEHEPLDIYPVGWLAAIKQRRLRATWRYVRKQIRQREWRAVRNTFNGYLAEPYTFPLGVTRCGSGWTKTRAAQSYWRQVERTVTATSSLTSDGGPS